MPSSKESVSSWCIRRKLSVSTYKTVTGRQLSPVFLSPWTVPLTDVSRALLFPVLSVTVVKKHHSPQTNVTTLCYTDADDDDDDDDDLMMI